MRRVRNCSALLSSAVTLGRGAFLPADRRAGRSGLMFSASAQYSVLGVTAKDETVRGVERAPAELLARLNVIRRACDCLVQKPNRGVATVHGSRSEVLAVTAAGPACSCKRSAAQSAVSMAPACTCASVTSRGRAGKGHTVHTGIDVRVQALPAQQHASVAQPARTWRSPPALPGRWCAPAQQKLSEAVRVDRGD
jgi:hypothetical protein